jgi:hypothetical protein
MTLVYYLIMAKRFTFHFHENKSSIKLLHEGSVGKFLPMNVYGFKIDDEEEKRKLNTKNLYRLLIGGFVNKIQRHRGPALRVASDDTFLYEIFSFLFPQDIGTERRQGVNYGSLKRVMKVCKHWYMFSKPKYYQRFHSFELFKDTRSLDVNDALDYCVENYCTDINLNNSRHLDDNMLIKLATRCKNVTSYSFCNCRNISDRSLNFLARKSKFISKIAMGKCNNISTKAVQNFIIKRGKLLTLLDLSNCIFVDSVLVADICKYAPSLRHLNLSNCGGGADASATGLDDLSCHHLAANRHSSLTHLQIGENGRITDAGVIELLSSIGRNLIELNLQRLPNLTSSSFIAISQQCRELLETLYVSDCVGLEDPMLHTISQSLEKLKLLDIRHCRNLTRGGIKSLVFHNNLTTLPDILV